MAKERLDPPQMGLRELKKRRTSLDLCRAARRLAVERGLDATTTDDIAKAVGVSARTFFNYYDTKLDAVIGPIREIGTPPARAEFTAGGPTGVLIEDLIALYASAFEPEDEIRETLAFIAELVKREPRVLAGFVAAGAQHEMVLGELLSARLGETMSRQFASLTAGIMSTLSTRAAMSLADNPTLPLATALNDQLELAAQLFGWPDDRRRSTR